MSQVLVPQPNAATNWALRWSHNMGRGQYSVFALLLVAAVPQVLKDESASPP